MAKKKLMIRTSEFSDYFRCPTKHHEAWVLGTEVGQKPAAAWGTAFHAAMECFLQGQRELFSGFPEDVKQAVKVTYRDHLEEWVNDKEVLIERTRLRHIYEDEEYIVYLQGTIDISYADIRTILDFKTRGDLAYAKNEIQLEEDFQLGCYTLLDGNAYPCPVYHLNVSRKPPHVANMVGASVGADRAAALLKELKRLAPEILRAHTDRNYLPTKNENHCHAYGGCPFLSKCKRSFASLDLDDRKKEPEPEPKPKPKEGVKEMNKPVLLFGVLPMRGEADATFMKPVYDAVNKHYGVTDHGFVNYGKGQAAVRERLSKHVSDLAPGYYFISHMSPNSEAICTAFLEAGFQVLRKVS